MTATSNITTTGQWQLATDAPAAEIILTIHGPAAEFAFSDNGVPAEDFLGHILPSYQSERVILDTGSLYVRGPAGYVVAVF